ncbi:hypothetical protein T06_989 [Trichinella sp. T6]|nr:hypothetical protein T06_989 [Trichinella sp. T6]
MVHNSGYKVKMKSYIHIFEEGRSEVNDRKMWY